jgi:hypothetical protein
MLRIGFTGTRKGLKPAQRAALVDYFLKMDRDNPLGIQLHHGDCVGADCHAHEIGLKLDFKIVIHPPIRDKYRAHCEPGTILPCLSYLDRNDMIVASTECLVACPDSRISKPRSGTWYTIRQAIRRGKAVTIITPDGTTATQCPTGIDDGELLDDWQPLEEEEA